ncbi:MAG: PAS domain-containing protein [Methylobacteriaceae bacterium]|jgi:PAS domain S-box-containing protein|nr:PAS domain-containing protein [Methylobacteriaceae bacterium]
MSGAANKFSGSTSGAVTVRSLSGHLIVFALRLLLPLMLFSGLLIWDYITSTQKELENRALSYVQALTEVLDSQILTVVRLMSDRANSCRPSEERLEELRWILSYALQIKSATMIYYDTTQARIYHPGPLGGDNPFRDHTEDFHAEYSDSLRDQAADFHADLSPGEVYSMSDLQRDNNRHLYVQLSVPVMCNGKQDGTLSVNIPPDYWYRATVQFKDWPGARFGVMDRKFRYIIPPVAGWEGQVDPFAAKNGDTLPIGVIRRQGLDDADIVQGIQQSQLSGWYLGVAIPQSVFNMPVQRSYFIFGGLGLAFLSASIGLALHYGRQVSRPVMQLASVAKEIGSMAEPRLLRSPVMEVNVVSRLLTKAAHDIDTTYRALHDSEERYRLAADVFQGAVFAYDGTTKKITYSPRFYQMYGDDVTWPDSALGESPIFHPDDRALVKDYINDVFHGNKTFMETEYRVRSRRGEWMWIWDRLAITRDKNGKPLRVIGALADITKRKNAEQNLELLVNELNHRVKNTLAIVQSLAANTLRADLPVDQLLNLFESRLIALSRAHDLITRNSWEGADIRNVIETAIAPFSEGTKAERFITVGPQIWVTPQLALSLSMALHELGTNAAKYGALSNETGRILLKWERGEEEIDGAMRKVTHLTWQETGGPRVERKPRHRGFGSRLIRQSLANDPSGSVEFEYPPEGIICRLRWTTTFRAGSDDAS